MAANTPKRFKCPDHWTLKQRLDYRTAKSGGPDACWTWKGAINSSGYGFMRWEGKTYLAHRLTWQETRGPIPPDKPHILHRCDNPPCCNSAHLWAGTIADNNLDKDRKGRGGDKRGMRNGRAKLTERDVRAIRSMAMRTTKVEIAKRLGVCKTTVSNVTSGKCWKHVM